MVEDRGVWWSARYLLPGAGDLWAESGTAKNFEEARQKMSSAIAEAELGRIGA